MSLQRTNADVTCILFTEVAFFELKEGKWSYGKDKTPDIWYGKCADALWPGSSVTGICEIRQGPWPDPERIVWRTGMGGSGPWNALTGSNVWKRREAYSDTVSWGTEKMCLWMEYLYETTGRICKTVWRCQKMGISDLYPFQCGTEFLWLFSAFFIIGWIWWRRSVFRCASDQTGCTHLWISAGKIPAQTAGMSVSGWQRRQCGRCQKSWHAGHSFYRRLWKSASVSDEKCRHWQRGGQKDTWFCNEKSTDGSNRWSDSEGWWRYNKSFW